MKCLLDKEAKLSDLTAQNKHLSSMLSGAHGNRWRKLQESTNLNEEGDRIESVPS